MGSIDYRASAEGRNGEPKSLREARRSTRIRQAPDLIEVLKLCDAPQEVIEKLKALISERVKEGVNRFSMSVDVKVYRPPKGVNKMVFRAVADEFVQGATLYEIWSFVHEYYSHVSKFNKALEYKGWETYVSRELLKLVEMGYAQASDYEALRELVRSRKKLERFKSMWRATSKKITIRPVAEEIRKLPSRPSKKKLEIEVLEKRVVVRGLCGRSLALAL
jgi:hypothetical protein